MPLCTVEEYLRTTGPLLGQRQLFTGPDVTAVDVLSGEDFGAGLDGVFVTGAGFGAGAVAGLPLEELAVVLALLLREALAGTAASFNCKRWPG